MIILDDVTKITGVGAKKKAVLKRVRATLPSDHRIALLAVEAEDKEVFIDLLAGLTLPTSGRIIRKATISFPVGHQGGFSSELSVRKNVAHLARVYETDINKVVNFVAEMSGLGKDFNKPHGELSGESKRQLSSILAFCIPFDVYILNEKIVRTSRKSTNKATHALFEARAKTAGMIIASDSRDFVRECCDMGVVLRGGRMRLFDNIERAISFGEKIGAFSSKKDGNRKKSRKERDEDDELEF